MIKIMPPHFNLEEAEISATPAEVTGSYLCSAVVRIFYLSVEGFRMFVKNTIANRSVTCHYV